MCQKMLHVHHCRHPRPAPLYDSLQLCERALETSTVCLQEQWTLLATKIPGLCEKCTRENEPGAGIRVSGKDKKDDDGGEGPSRREREIERLERERLERVRREYTVSGCGRGPRGRRREGGE